MSTRASLAILSGLVLALIAYRATFESQSMAAGVERLAVTPAKPQRPISLRDRLVVGLQARLKSEVAFVELTAARVASGHLPQRLVDETFFWARGRAAIVRNGRTRRPIIYFQPVMAARARRLGVDL